MVNDDLIFRLRRINAAIGAVEETDISKFIPEVTNDGYLTGFYQDWSGGLSNEHLANIAHSLIQNIASLEDHLRKWATHSGQEKTKVDEAFNDSHALKVIKDLWNNEKHEYPPRGGGHSGQSPKLDQVKRVLRLTTKPEKGSSVGVAFTPQGTPQKLGSGDARVIVTGDILDRDGNRIGDLHKTALDAIEAWEGVLIEFGVEL